MKKAEIEAHFGHRNVPTKSHKTFNFRNSPKFLSKLKVFPNSLPFSVFVRSDPFFAASSPGETRRSSELFFGYSVVKYHQKRERAATFQVLPENLCVTAPKTIFEFNNSLILSFGSGNDAAPAFLNPGLQTVCAAECRLIFLIIKSDAQARRQTSI